MITSAYVHLPFCQSICSYCDFCKFLYQYQDIDSYLNALEKEIKKAKISSKLSTLYIGGGTPSCLSVSQLEKLFSFIDLIPLQKDAEVTMEMNPIDMTKEKLNLFFHHRVNRLSIGVQSFQKRLLDLLDRDYINIKEKIDLAKEVGFQNISLDLIYAIPTETLEEVRKDLEELKSLDVSHVSCYSLMIEPHTKLYLNKIKPIDEQMDLAMYQLIGQELKKQGYQQYEISNYAKEGKQSRHNLVYWNNQQYYGFGLGASSYLGNIRYTNTRNLKDYLKDQEKGEKEVLTLMDQFRYELILGLRKIRGINQKEIEKKYGKKIMDVFELKDLLDQGILKDDGIYLSIHPDYLYVSNEILTRIVE